MIRVPKIFVRFERFVFKEKSVFISFLSVCPKHSLFERFVFKERIRVYLCLSVCQKYSIRVQRKSVFKKSSPPKFHTPMQNPGGPPLSYLSCPETTIPSPDTTITITSLHHFTTFLPFTIYIP